MLRTYKQTALFCLYAIHIPVMLINLIPPREVEFRFPGLRVEGSNLLCPVQLPEILPFLLVELSVLFAKTVFFPYF